MSTFGSSFSADVLVTENQKIFICREKLSQHIYSKLIPDEKSETLREAILDSVIHLIPTSGTTIQVDAAPSLQSIANSFVSLQSDDILRSNNICLDIGRIHNPNKNPVAENAVKEFRKEILRLKPRGGPISETERIIVTRNINSRIRNRGLSAKEILLRRELANNTPAPIDDESLSEQQYDLRMKTNLKHNLNVDDSDHTFKVGDRVYIKSGLLKTRAREEYIISSVTKEQGIDWAFVHKSETNLRKKTYKLKFIELVHVSDNFSKTCFQQPDDDSDSEPFHGFPSQHTSGKTALSEIIVTIGASIPLATVPKMRGRPKKYPDYTNYDEQSLSNVNQVKVSPDKVLLHGYIQDDNDEDDSDDDLYVTISVREHSPDRSLVKSSDVEFYSDNDAASTHSVPQYISSDDDPFEHNTEPWWDTHSNQYQKRFKSETDPHFLHRAQIVSTDCSSLGSPNFDDPSVDNLSSHQPNTSQAGRVFDFSEALDALHAPLPENVVTLDTLPQPTPLPLLRASS